MFRGVSAGPGCQGGAAPALGLPHQTPQQGPQEDPHPQLKLYQLAASRFWENIKCIEEPLFSAIVLVYFAILGQE